MECRYSGHNTSFKLATIKRPDGKYYEIDMPDDILDNKIPFFDWMNPIVERVEKIYQEDMAYDKLHTIIRDQYLYLEGLGVYYDLIGTKVQIYDIIYVYFSIYGILKKLFNINDLNSKIIETLAKLNIIITEVEYTTKSKQLKLKKILEDGNKN